MKILEITVENALATTSWEDGPIKITLQDVIQHLDRKGVSVKNVPVKNIKPLIIDQDYSGAAKSRVASADLSYPIIILVKDGKYKSILDGNHRAFRALQNKQPTIKVRELDLDSDVPQAFKEIF